VRPFHRMGINKVVGYLLDQSFPHDSRDTRKSR
jgi:hypothetical protein